MSALLSSPFIVPVAAILAGVVYMVFNSQRRLREAELEHERLLRQEERAHALKLKEMDLELARLGGRGTQAPAAD